MKAKEIIENIESNGSIDWIHLFNSAKLDKVTPYNYLFNYIKTNFNCHGNTAKAVTNFYIWRY